VNSSWAITTAAAAEPVSLTTAKLHLRVDSTDDDTILAIYISAAVGWVEEYLRRPLVARTITLKMDTFPAGQEIELPFPTVSAVSSVKYYDPAASLTTLSSADYWTVLAERHAPGLVILKDTAAWPSLQDDRPRAVEIVFVCGYGAAAADVPADIRNAILLIVAQLYENRVPEISGTIISRYAFAAESLLNPHRFYALA